MTLMDVSYSAALMRPTAQTPPQPWLSTASEDTIEGALAGCLAALANLARVTGGSQRVGRMLEMLESLCAPAAEEAPEALGFGAAALQVGPTIDRLSAREREVSVLISRGLTNRQIADELIISERTADTHVQNILAKLGVSTRAQVAAWVIERALRS
jgi:DNA-binding NarL/FixJ family response regulator